MAIVFVILVVVLALMGIKRPFYGLLGLLAVSVLQPGELYPVLAPLHLERNLAIVVLISLLLNGERLRFPGITQRFLLFYGAMLLAIPLAFWPGNSASACISFAPVVVYHLLIVALLTDEKRFHKYLILEMLLVGWLAGSAYWEYHQGVMQVAMGIERAYGLTSSGGDPNSLANTLVISMALLILLTTKDNSWKVRLASWCVMGLSLVTIISTGSRTAFFSFLILVVLTLLRKKKNWKYLAALPILGFFLWITIPQQYKVRYESVDHLQNDDSYQNRVLSWEGGVQMFLSNPLTGIGPDNYAIANGEKFWPGFPRHWLNAHSLYFILIGELGLVGVLTWLGFLVGFIMLNIRLSRKMRDNPDIPSYIRDFPGMCNIFIVILLIEGYSGHNLYRTNWYSMAALSGAVQYLLLNQEAPSEETAADPIAPNRLLAPMPVHALKQGL